MTWWKNGLLLAAGGVAGLALAAWLESEGKSDDYDEDYEERPRRNVPKADGMELLVEKVRRDAEWAMEECTTDAEREKVYEEVAATIRELQATIQKRGEEIIADLREQAKPTSLLRWRCRRSKIKMFRRSSWQGLRSKQGNGWDFCRVT